MESSRTILVVDDVAMFRELGRLFLARSGRVLTASNGKDALACIRRERPDLVVADADMPVMDGSQLCSAIKRDPGLRDIPVVMLLPEADARAHANAVRAGADDVLSKPLSRVSLIATVNRFLNFPRVRGLPRVETSTPVRLRVETRESLGVLRNLSRGGVFVESGSSLAPQTEVELRFELPDSGAEVAPTAQVVWRCEQDRSQHIYGMGMRFLAIDGGTLRSLDDFVFERAGGALQNMGGAPQ